MSGIPYSSITDVQTWAASVMNRTPDFVIGGTESPYMRRWWVVPRNEFCNVYLHEILRSDDDRAAHDHPWGNTSFLIDGEYEEVTYYRNQPWNEHCRYKRSAGDVVHREAQDAHRLIIPDGGRAVSLFFTGPKVRDWGFWCPEGPRFVPWQQFTAGENGELVGRGCA